MLFWSTSPSPLEVHRCLRGFLAGRIEVFKGYNRTRMKAYLLACKKSTYVTSFWCCDLSTFTLIARPAISVKPFSTTTLQVRPMTHA